MTECSIKGVLKYQFLNRDMLNKALLAAGASLQEKMYTVTYKEMNLSFCLETLSSKRLFWSHGIGIRFWVIEDGVRLDE